MNPQTVMQAIENPLPTTFAKFDLRFFSKIAFTDGYDGKMSPSTGVEYTAYLYGTRVVYEHGRHFFDSDGGPRKKNGDESILRYYSAAQLYLQIQNIARAKFFLEDMEICDRVCCTKDAMSFLKTHPQYQHLEEVFGLAMVETEEDISVFRVYVSKYDRSPVV